MTSASGNLSAISVAQMPVPVPINSQLSQPSSTASSRTKVKDVLRIFDWRQIQLIFEGHDAQVMYDGFMVVLLLVVGLPVFAVSWKQFSTKLASHIIRGDER